MTRSAQHRTIDLRLYVSSKNRELDGFTKGLTIEEEEEKEERAGRGEGSLYRHRHRHSEQRSLGRSLLFAKEKSIIIKGVKV